MMMREVLRDALLPLLVAVMILLGVTVVVGLVVVGTQIDDCDSAVEHCGCHHLCLECK